MTTAPPATVYTGRSANWPLIWLSIVLAVPLLAMGATSDGAWSDSGLLLPLAIAAAAIVVNLLTATSVRTTTGPNGVTAHFGVVGWPRFHYPVERIRSATAVELRSGPCSWGIWWSPRRGLLLTLGAGPAIRLELTNGRIVTVSAPDAPAAVDALERARRAP